MSYTPMTAAEIISLKAAVKSEMLRRASSIGGLATYGGNNYDFSTMPVTDGAVKTEHGQKTVNLLL